MGPDPMAGVPISRGNFGHRLQGEGHATNRGGGWRDAAASPGTPRVTATRARRGRKGAPRQASGGGSPADTLISDVQPPGLGDKGPLGLTPPGLWRFAAAPRSPRGAVCPSRRLPARLSRPDLGAAWLAARLLTFLCVSLRPCERESPGASSPQRTLRSCLPGTPAPIIPGPPFV